MRSRPWLQGIAWLVLTFSAGAVCGTVYERHAATARTPVESHDALHHLSIALRLDPAQQEAVSRILATHQLEVDEAWRTLQPHVRATLDSASREILSVLRPDQAAMFRQMLATHAASHR